MVPGGRGHSRRTPCCGPMAAPAIHRWVRSHARAIGAPSLPWLPTCLPPSSAASRWPPPMPPVTSAGQEAPMAQPHVRHTRAISQGLKRPATGALARRNTFAIARCGPAPRGDQPGAGGWWQLGIQETRPWGAPQHFLVQLSGCCRKPGPPAPRNPIPHTPEQLQAREHGRACFGVPLELCSPARQPWAPRGCRPAGSRTTPPPAPC